MVQQAYVIKKAMEVTNNDIARIGGFGIAGALMAGAYKIMLIYAEQKMAVPLCVPVDALSGDEILMDLLSSVESIALAIDRVAIIQLIDSLDRLVYLRIQIQHNPDISIVPDTDKEEAHVLCQRAKRSLLRIIDSCKAEPVGTIEPATNVKLLRFCRDISESIDEHMVAIIRTCNKHINM